MTRGVTAATRLAARVAGTSASTFGREVDLATDPAGDGLAVSPAGAILAVSAALTWTGVSAAIIAADPSGALEGEAWIALADESGRVITTEGS